MEFKCETLKLSTELLINKDRHLPSQSIAEQGERRRPMPSIVVLRFLLLLLFMIMIIPQKSDGQLEEWCIADEQTPDEILQAALDWACGRGGADCRKIQVNQPCYLPNTLLNHASYAFNSYYQRLKKKGATCYFNAAAMITDLDPSHNLCRYEYIP